MGRLSINRKPPQRIFVTASKDVDAAELHRQLATEGIWLDVEFSNRAGQILVRVSAPPAILVLREELV